MGMVAETTNGARAKGQAEPAREESRASRTAEPSAACDYSGLVTTFLIVDDHPTFRRTARVLLESEGFEVVGEAADGASAIKPRRRCVLTWSCWTSISLTSTDSRWPSS